MKILIIEDDEETATYIVRGLREHGHVTDQASNGQDGLFMATSEFYDMLVLDRMLPGIDGLDVVRRIRAAGVKAPVLFLTALRGVGDRVQGLEAGGDDYLVKPFAFAELLARLNALARRPPLSQAPTVLRILGVNPPQKFDGRVLAEGTPDEIRKALTLIPGRHDLQLIEGAGHDLKRPAFDLDAVVAEVGFRGSVHLIGERAG